MKINAKKLAGIIGAVSACVIVILFIAFARSEPIEEEFEVNFPQSENELDAVADEYKNNVYLDSRGVGTCDKLLGNVHVTFIFVNDSKSKWENSEQKAFENFAVDTFKRMEEDAALYGKELNIDYDQRTAKVNFDFNYNGDKNWSDAVLVSVDMSAYTGANLSLEQEFGVDEAAIVFLLNYEGRSFSSSSENSEYSVVFKNAAALYHELCHLFGAKDYYFPDETKKYSEEIFGNSIMDNARTGQMDDLTAYLIGWRDDISEKAEKFLEKTNHLTAENISEAKEVS